MIINNYNPLLLSLGKINVSNQSFDFMIQSNLDQVAQFLFNCHLLRILEILKVQWGKMRLLRTICTER